MLAILLYFLWIVLMTAAMTRLFHALEKRQLAKIRVPARHTHK